MLDHLFEEFVKGAIHIWLESYPLAQRGHLPDTVTPTAIIGFLLELSREQGIRYCLGDYPSKRHTQRLSAELRYRNLAALPCPQGAEISCLAVRYPFCRNGTLN